MKLIVPSCGVSQNPAGHAGCVGCSLLSAKVIQVIILGERTEERRIRRMENNEIIFGENTYENRYHMLRNRNVDMISSYSSNLLAFIQTSTR